MENAFLLELVNIKTLEQRMLENLNEKEIVGIT